MKTLKSARRCWFGQILIVFRMFQAPKMHLKGYIVLLCIVMIICGCDAARKGRKRQRSRQKDAEHRKVTPTSTNVNSNVTHLQTTVPTSRTTLKPSSTTIQTTPGRTREQIVSLHDQ